MENDSNIKLDLRLLLPAGLLILETVAFIVLLVIGFEITPLMTFFFIIIGIFLSFQVSRQLALRVRVQKSLDRMKEGKKLIKEGHTFKAIKLWKELLSNLPKSEYKDVLDLLEETYGAQNMNAAVQQVKAIRSESLNFFEKTKNPQKATIHDRREWQTTALEIRKMIKALPTEPNQDLSESLNE